MKCSYRSYEHTTSRVYMTFNCQIFILMNIIKFYDCYCIAGRYFSVVHGDRHVSLCIFILQIAELHRQRVELSRQNVKLMQQRER